MHRALITVLLAGAACACSALNPVAPVDQTPVALVMTSFSSISLPSVSPGQFIYYNAYAVTRDGGYIDVTTQAQWATSDPSMLRPGGVSGNRFFFTGVAPGNVVVIARHQGTEASLPASVVPANRVVFPSVSVSITGLPVLGESARLTAVYRESQSSLIQTVTSGVTWTSSNPTVVAIEDGVARAVGVGTSICSVSYNGATSIFYFSVHPRASL
jgi:hypothetical protein